MASTSSTTTTTTTPGHAWLKALGTKLHACASRLRGHSSSFFFRNSTAPSSVAALLPALAVALLVCGTVSVLSRVVVFFLPLVVSTSVCCAAACFLVADAAEEPEEAKEVVLRCGGGRAQPEAGLLEVYGGANASKYGARRDVVAGCFLLRRPGGGWTKKRGVHDHEDGEEDVVFAGRVVAAGIGDDELLGGVTLEEELVALRVDRLAEGVWDRYFGGCSRWNCATDVEL